MFLRRFKYFYTYTVKIGRNLPSNSTISKDNSCFGYIALTDVDIQCTACHTLNDLASSSQFSEEYLCAIMCRRKYFRCANLKLLMIRLKFWSCISRKEDDFRVTQFHIHRMRCRVVPKKEHLSSSFLHINGNGKINSQFQESLI